MKESTIGVALKTLADWVFRIPGVEWGFLQQQEGLDQRRTCREPGAQDAWILTSERQSLWRVYVMHKGKFTECQGKDLRGTVAGVLAGCGIDLAEKIAEADKLREDTEQRTPPSMADPKERATMIAEWRRKCGALADTIGQLTSLKAWLEPLNAETAETRREEKAS